MGASGALVMSFFGSLFASLTLLLELKKSGPEVGLPFIVFAVVALVALVVAKLPGHFGKPEGSGRVIMWSSIGEGAALFVVNEILIGLGRSDLIIPSMVVIVGLHFVPIAYLSPFRPLYALAAVMVTTGLAGLSAAQPSGGTIAGFTAAGALIVASIAAIHREWSAKRGIHHSL